MSTNKKSKGRRGYHHGDLAEAMVAAALKLIAEFGPAGFTFAEVTRVVGVSPAAPYRHFRDRDALMAAIALRGFEHFTKALRDAWNGGKPDPLTGVKNIAQAHLAFSESQPAYYSAMFEARLARDAARKVSAASDEALQVLREAAEVLIATMDEGQRPPALMMSLHIWSLAHGTASLFGNAKANRHPIPMAPDELLEAAVLVYLDGLGLPAR